MHVVNQLINQNTHTHRAPYVACESELLLLLLPIVFFSVCSR